MLIKIETDNAVFEEDYTTEISRILKEVANKIENQQWPERIRDINGNIVGSIIYDNN